MKRIRPGRIWTILTGRLYGNWKRTSPCPRLQGEILKRETSRCREFRIACATEERDLLWKGRKNAFGAIGRVSPFYYVQPGVVPRTQIAPTLARSDEIAKK